MFSGKIQYSQGFDATYGIRSPREKLWLDYSEVTGALNLIRVSPYDGYANVDLQCEPFNDRDPKGMHLSWRVSDRVVNPINPFEEIVGAAPQSEQFVLNQEVS